MPNENASYAPEMRSDRIKAQIDKLEALCHHPEAAAALSEFDSETEEILSDVFGPDSRRLETYKYATIGDAETMVNMPEEAQEHGAQDIPLKAIQQRRQALQACLSDLEISEEKEIQALAGEDHEDPPMMS
ncbi:MAG TPA: hypothetical protein VFA38_00725 [Nitrospirales bacterium]|nr:hypothetical protein [Nitrospirales bacterium]